MKRYFHDIIIALESILSNKLKSILTALGIIFGVAAVISMLAIGKGAQQEILEQIKMVGVNNILINPVVEEQSSENGESEENSSGEKQQSKFSRGLSLQDVVAIREHVPSVQRISPEISLNAFAMKGGKRSPAKLVGVTNDFFSLYNLSLTEGTFFNNYQEEHGIQVCVIGANIDAKFFPKTNPLNQYIKFGAVWLKVIGVLESTGGITEHLRTIIGMVNKDTGAFVFYDEDPERLIEKLENVYRSVIYQRHVEALEEGGGPDGVIEP